MGLEEASPRNNGGKGKGNQAHKERQSQSEMRQGSVYCRQGFTFIRWFWQGGVGVREGGKLLCPRSKRKWLFVCSLPPAGHLSDIPQDVSQIIRTKNKSLLTPAAQLVVQRANCSYKKCVEDGPPFLAWGLLVPNRVQSSFKTKNTSKFEAISLELKKIVLSDVTQAKKDTLYILTPKS